MKLQVLLTIAFNAFACTEAFGSFNFGTKAPKSAISKEAIEAALVIYDEKVGSKIKGSGNTSKSLSSLGVPKKDIDGTSISSNKPNTKLFDVDVKQREKAFREIATLYGTDEALEMTRNLPNILAFNVDNFKPSLDEFGIIFGEDEAKAMVVRNPGLLGVKPENAAKSDNSTMQFSYIIAITRPAGPFLLGGLLSLLMVPAIEGITGVSRAEFFSSLGF